MSILKKNFFKTEEEQMLDRKYLEAIKGTPIYFQEQMNINKLLPTFPEEKQFEIERIISTHKQFIYLQRKINAEFTTETLFEIHRFLFEDLYYWAGELRENDMKKNENVFCRKSLLRYSLNELFDNLKSKNYLKGMNPKEFSKNMTEFMVTLNYIHPFRDGNGRSKRTIIDQIATNAGYSIDFSKVDKEILLAAEIKHFNEYQEDKI